MEKKDEAMKAFLFFAGKVESFLECLSDDSLVSLIEKMQEAGFSDDTIKEIEWATASVRKEIGILNSQMNYIGFQMKQVKSDETLDLPNSFETLIHC